MINILDRNILNLFNATKLRDDFFLGNLEKRCTPETCKHYLQSFISFLEFMIYEPNSKETMRFPPSAQDCLSLKLRMVKWRQSYNKAVDERRWEIEGDENDALITPDQVEIFEQGAMSRQVIKLFGNILDNPSYIVGATEYTNIKDYLIVSIALVNAHRSGVAANMTIEEFEKHSIQGETVNIEVKKHKTFRQHGYACVCLLLQKFHYLKIFVEKVRPQFPSHCDNVFLSKPGYAMSSGFISNQIDTIWRKSGVYDEKEPPKKKGATVFRRSVTTLIHQNDRENIQNVADLLAHSTTTAAKTYRRKQLNINATAGAAAINKAFHPSSTTTKPPVIVTENT